MHLLFLRQFRADHRCPIAQVLTAAQAGQGSPCFEILTEVLSPDRYGQIVTPRVQAEHLGLILCLCKIEKAISHA